jgi:hypothetical protein
MAERVFWCWSKEIKRKSIGTFSVIIPDRIEGEAELGILREEE